MEPPPPPSANEIRRVPPPPPPPGSSTLEEKVPPGFRRSDSGVTTAHQAGIIKKPPVKGRGSVPTIRPSPSNMLARSLSQIDLGKILPRMKFKTLDKPFRPAVDAAVLDNYDHKGWKAYTEQLRDTCENSPYNKWVFPSIKTFLDFMQSLEEIKACPTVTMKEITDAEKFLQVAQEVLLRAISEFESKVTIDIQGMVDSINMLDIEIRGLKGSLTFVQKGIDLSLPREISARELDLQADLAPRIQNLEESTQALTRYQQETAVRKVQLGSMRDCLSRNSVIDFPKGFTATMLYQDSGPISHEFLQASCVESKQLNVFAVFYLSNMCLKTRLDLNDQNILSSICLQMIAALQAHCNQLMKVNDKDGTVPYQQQMKKIQGMHDEFVTLSLINTPSRAIKSLVPFIFENFLDRDNIFALNETLTKTKNLGIRSSWGLTEENSWRTQFEPTIKENLMHLVDTLAVEITNHVFGYSSSLSSVDKTRLLFKRLPYTKQRYLVQLMARVKKEETKSA